MPPTSTSLPQDRFTNQAAHGADSSERSAAVTAFWEQLVVANQILVRHGIVDSFGHVSVRHPERSDRFLMARRIAPGQVRIEHIREFDLSGELVEQDGTPVFFERYIHNAIYAARSDVNSVVHSHSPVTVAFSVSKSRSLRPVCHTCGFLRNGAPVFEIREHVGDASNLLITSNELGRHLAASLGQEAVVLMRGHGSTTVGQSVAESVYRAIYTETNARIQAQAMGWERSNTCPPTRPQPLPMLGQMA